MRRQRIKRILNIFYQKIPFKRQFFTLIKHYFVLPKAIYQHLYFKGKFKVAVDGKSFYLIHYGYEVENNIFWQGLKGKDWEGASMVLWMELCESSRCIVDIGANTGVYSLVAKTLNPNAQVYAFEPVERIFNKAVRNCEVNHYDIHCIQKAVSSYDGKATIYDPGTEHVYSVTLGQNLNPSDVAVTEVEVETIKMNTFIETCGEIPPIDLMKIDVETKETEVLEGMGHYLSRLRPNMLIEILSNEVGAKIESLVRGMGYLYFNIDETKGPRIQARITKSDHYNYLLCREEDAFKIGLG